MNAARFSDMTVSYCNTAQHHNPRDLDMKKAYLLSSRLYKLEIISNVNGHVNRSPFMTSNIAF